MKLADIHIPDLFIASPPAVWKMEQCRKFFEEHGHLDRELVVTENNLLIDGYVGYLVLEEAGVTETRVKKIRSGTPSQTTCYIGAVHIPQEGMEPNNKTYYWRVTTGTKNADQLEVGKLVRVRTSRGAQTARVTEVLDRRPGRIGKIKTVISVLATDTEERND